jgi:predicted PurR-regulated permease PerM
MKHEQGMRPQTLALYTAVVALTLLGAFALYKLIDLIVLLVFCMIAATALEPLVNRLRRGPFNRAQGILIVYTLIFAIIVGILLLTVPVLVNQVSNLVANLPQLQKDLTQAINSLNLGYFSAQITTFINKFDFSQIASALGQGAAGAAIGVVSAIFTTILAFVLIFYWMTERTSVKRYVVSFFPTDTGQRVRRIWDDIEVKVGAWTRGQMVLMGTVAGAALIFYSVVGIPYAPVLAIIAGLLELIPVIGPWIAAMPTLLVAATLGLDKVIIIAVYSVVIQLVEANVLVPRIMKSSVGISPLTVIVALLAGEAIGGILGALLAVPLAGAVQVVIEDLRTINSPAEQAEKTAGTSKEVSATGAGASRMEELTAAEAEQAGVGPAQPVTYASTFNAHPQAYSSIADLATQVTTPDQSVLITNALGPDTQVGPLVQTTLPADGSAVGKVSTSGPALTTIATSATPTGPRATVVTQASDGQAVLTTEPAENGRL